MFETVAEQHAFDIGIMVGCGVSMFLIIVSSICSHFFGR